MVLSKALTVLLILKSKDLYVLQPPLTHSYFISPMSATT
jgi:hypothetical protein